MIVKLACFVIVIWIVVISYLIFDRFQINKARIAQEVNTQLANRERKLVNRYADKIVKLQLDLGVVEQKEPQTIKDMIEILSSMVTAIDVNDTE